MTGSVDVVASKSRPFQKGIVVVCSFIGSLVSLPVVLSLYAMPAHARRVPGSEVIRHYPIIIAHHGSGEDWPENTLYAIRQSQKHHVKMINLTLELSRDKVPFLFHGFRLSRTTNGHGDPEAKTMAQLKKLDAGYFFKRHGRYIYRGRGIKIPTLKEALRASHVKRIFDIKTHRYRDLIDKLAGILTPGDWKDSVFYSTDKSAMAYLESKYPHATVFQNRDKTRKLLLDNKIEGKVDVKNSANWAWLGFENNRDMNICEHFTLGWGCTSVAFKNLWQRGMTDAIHRQDPAVHLVMFGVDDCALYDYATTIGMDAIYTNSIMKMQGCKLREQRRVLKHAHAKWHVTGVK